MDLDVTLLVQITLLTVLLRVFGRGLFAPMLAVIQQRQGRIVGLAHEAEQLSRLSAADRLAYEEKLLAGRRQALQRRDSLRQQGRDEARRLVAKARAAVADEQAMARAAVKSNERAVQQQLQVQVPQLSEALLQRLLGTAPPP